MPTCGRSLDTGAWRRRSCFAARSTKISRAITLASYSSSTPSSSLFCGNPQTDGHGRFRCEHAEVRRELTRSPGAGGKVPAALRGAGRGGREDGGLKRVSLRSGLRLRAQTPAKCPREVLIKSLL